MKISTARTKTSKTWKTQDISWADFLDRLRAPMRTAETQKEYRGMSKASRDRAKEAAGGFVGGSLSGGQRKTENVTDRWIVTLDADRAKPGAWESVTALWDYRMACYPTHSSTVESPRLRWCVPVDRAMTPDEYPAVARMVASWFGIEQMDPTTYEVARLMYWPTCSKDAPYELREQEGPVLSVDEVLRVYGPGEEWREVWRWPTSTAELTVRELTRKKAGEPTEKPGLIGLFCRTWDVDAAIAEFLPDVYLPTQVDGRYTYSGGSTTGGAIVYDEGAFLYSNHATDPAAGRSVNAFDLVRIHKFGAKDLDAGEDVSVANLPSSAAMREWAAALPQLKAELVKERSRTVYECFADLEGPAPDDTSWTEKLEVNRKTGEMDPTQQNAFLILVHDPALRGAMGYDLFDDKVKLLRDVPWRPAGSVPTTGKLQLWTDLDDAGLRGYLQHKWKFRSDKDLQAALELAFHQNEFHPIRDYLKSLVWDGTPRVETLLIDYFGTPDTPYTRSIARKWMAGAVSRVTHPGSKFDCILTVVGAQGVGKSTFARILSRGHINDSLVDVGSKDSFEALHGSWIVELAELASVRKIEVERVKAFVSKQEDTYRAAYARRAATYPRQCVFFGSTNEVEFLRDRTGERRYWIFEAQNKLIDFDRLRANVDQLWAEAVQIYQKGEPLWLTTKDEKTGWLEMVQTHSIQDEEDGQLSEYLDRLLPDNWEELGPEARRDIIRGAFPVDELACTYQRTQVSLMEIRVELCGDDRMQIGGNDKRSRRLADLMNNRPGWVKSKKKVRIPHYGPQYVYVRQEEG